MSSSDPKLLSRSDAPWALDGTTATACQCYTQQGTRVATTFEFCLNTVKRGYFDNTRPDSLAVQMDHPGQFPAPSPHRPLNQMAAAPEVPSSSRVVVVPYEKGQFLW